MSTQEASGVGAAVDPVQLAQVSQFLFHEAALLDERRLEEWLDLFTDDAVYWIPQGPDPDPRHDVQLLLDEKWRMRERVLRLSSGFAYSQDPPSRTVHVIGNVQVAPGERSGELYVTSAQLIAEVRRGRQSLYAGHVRHVLVPHDGDGWRIRRKEVRLANSDLPLGNVTFLM